MVLGFARTKKTSARKSVALYKCAQKERANGVGLSPFLLIPLVRNARYKLFLGTFVLFLTVFLPEFPHKGGQCLGAFQSHGVIEGGPQAADRTVALKANQAVGRGFFNELLLQFGVGETEGDIH